MTAPTATRPIYEIARDVHENWLHVYFGAVPYLEAMDYLTTLDESYGEDPAWHVLNYFLSNATTWRGEKAREIKAEIKALLATRK
jgi:hypothetical protein